MNSTLANTLAWIGAAQIIGMYLLLSFDYIKPRKFYHFFNATGGAFVCFVCVMGEVWQAAIVEGIWSIMATFFFFRTVIKDEGAWSFMNMLAFSILYIRYVLYRIQGIINEIIRPK